MSLELVSPRPEDAWFWHKLRTQPSTQKFNPSGEVRLDALAEQIAASNRPLGEQCPVHRFYLKRDDGRFLAVIGLKNLDWSMGTGELGYVVDEDHHNRGYGTEAARLLIHKAFAETTLRKLRAFTVATNIASHRVLERNGFSREGYLKDEYWIGGRPEDAILWAILRPS